MQLSSIQRWVYSNCASLQLEAVASLAFIWADRLLRAPPERDQGATRQEIWKCWQTYPASGISFGFTHESPGQALKV